MLNKDMDKNTDKNMQDQSGNPFEKQDQAKLPDVTAGIYVRGHIKIHDPTTGEVFIDKPNAIHYENMSEAIAYALSHRDQQYMYEMHFGNGGTAVDSTGVITYLAPNTTNQSADLYNPTYYKIIDDTDTNNNADVAHNKMQVRHIAGNPYSDIIITCLLDYGEPATQAVFDNSTTLNDTYTFDELGIKARAIDGTAGAGKLLTHVIFHPVQKSLNRLIQIDYTVRIQTLTNLSAIG
jgi:uncharacterized protein (UPF0333 family)